MLTKWKQVGITLASLGWMALSSDWATAEMMDVKYQPADARPTTIGGYSLTAFGSDSTSVGTSESSISTPLGGTLGFSTPLSHETIGDGWATWSNGYTGDVYVTGGTDLTMTLAPGVGAFVFYTEPEVFASYTFVAKASDGSTLTETINGDGGAKGFGFYTSPGTSITSIELTTTAAANGFAVGEFSIAAVVPEPSTIVSVSIGGLIAFGYGWRRRRHDAKA